MRRLLLSATAVPLIVAAITVLRSHAAPPAKERAPIAEVPQARQSILGTALFPANYPAFTAQDLRDFYNLAAHMGSHVLTVSKWTNPIPPHSLRQIMAMGRAKGLKFHLYFDAISLEGGRRRPEIPAHIGGRSFADPNVRAAFRKEALALARLKPDLLGLSTEVNYLAENPREFEHFLTLERETYQAIKEADPQQVVTVSFQWDYMRARNQFSLLSKFEQGVDTYSFTTYPEFHFASAKEIPETYYSLVRRYLPKRRIGFSEVGWSAATAAQEEDQAAFFVRLPALMRDVRPEYLTLAMLHDVKALFPAELKSLNTMGVRRHNGSPKRCWEIIEHLPF